MSVDIARPGRTRKSGRPTQKADAKPPSPDFELHPPPSAARVVRHARDCAAREAIGGIARPLEPRVVGADHPLRRSQPEKSEQRLARHHTPADRPRVDLVGGNEGREVRMGHQFETMTPQAASRAPDQPTCRIGLIAAAFAPNALPAAVAKNLPVPRTLTSSPANSGNQASRRRRIHHSKKRRHQSEMSDVKMPSSTQAQVEQCRRSSQSACTSDAANRTCSETRPCNPPAVHRFSGSCPQG